MAATGTLPVMAVCAVMGLVAGLHVHSRIEATLTGYRLSSAQAEHAELSREEKALRLELATRSAAHRLESAARRVLGMVEPASDRIYNVDEPVSVPLTARAEAPR